MANDSIINSRNLIMAATLVSLLGMTPLCSGKSYEFYPVGSAKLDTIDISSTDAEKALNAMITAYHKDYPSYKVNGIPYFAKTDEENEYLLLIYPNFGGCGSSCVPAKIVKKGDNMLFLEDIEALSCRAGDEKDMLKCDHSSGFL